MNYFLILIILGMGAGGYYEYTGLQQKGDADRQQLSDLGAKVDALQAQNKKVEDDNAKLTKSVADEQAAVTDVTRQLQAAQTALLAAQEKALQAAKAAATTPAVLAPPVPAPPTNSLGTIATLGGKSFQNCQLLKVEADGIVISYSDGITKILYGLLPPDLQKRFGYDPHAAEALTKAQTQNPDEQKKAATNNATGN